MSYTVKLVTTNLQPNVAYLSPAQKNLKNFEIASLDNSLFALVGGVNGVIVKVLVVSDDEELEENQIQLTREHMKMLGVAVGDKILVEPCPEGFHECFKASQIRVLVYDAKYEVTNNAKDIELLLPETEMLPMVDTLTTALKNHVLYKRQIISFTYLDQDLRLVVDRITFVYGDGHVVTPKSGVLGNETKIKVDKFRQNRPFPPGVNPDEIAKELKNLGIGGMDDIITEIVKSCFKIKYLSTDLRRDLNPRPNKGILFHGPPGTGKTLVARNLCQVILCVTPQVINGPELTAKYHGESEKNIRKVFSDAVADYELYGKASPLHVFIFDEFDSVGMKRTDNMDHAVSNRIVAQLLTLLDGVNQLPNIFLLTTTNRVDMIDTALLRPGRIGMRIYVDFPNEAKRVDILNLKIQPYARKKLIAEDVDVGTLGALTEGFSGSDLEEVMSNALVKMLDNITFDEMEDEADLPKITAQDFRTAIEKVKASKLD